MTSPNSDPGSKVFTPEQQAMLERHGRELVDSGIVDLYRQSLEYFASLIDRPGETNLVSEEMRRVARSVHIPIAGVNIYKGDDASRGESIYEYILVAYNPTSSNLNPYSRVETGEVTGDEVSCDFSRFTSEHVRILERQVENQESMGIEITMPSY